MHQFLRFVRKNWLLILILLLGAFLRFYRLDELPGEMFGDINENYEDISEIMAGKLSIFFPRNNGREGMLFYLTAIMAQFLGLSYLTQKTTVALIGVVTILTIYFFSKEFKNAQIGLLAPFLLATSRWHIIFSRIGFRAILAPLFVTLTFIFFLKAIKKVKVRDFILTGFFLGLGMYTYTAFRIMPLVILTCWLFDLLFDRKRKRKAFLFGCSISFLVFALTYLPLGIYAWQNPGVYWGHVKKMIALKENPSFHDLFLNLINNITNQLKMLHLKGDVIFRVNLTRRPHLDLISGALFLLGVIALLNKSMKRFIFFIFPPFVMLQLPSILVLNYPADVPSATRSIGVIPFVLLITASGIEWLFEKIKKKKYLLAASVLAFILAAILGLNYKEYFYDYADGLPNHNVAFGKIIASQIDKLPSDVRIYIYSCCWGDWGQPEPKGIECALKKKRKIIFFHPEISEEFDCQKLRDGNTKKMVIWDPTRDKELVKLKKCLPGGREKVFKSRFGETIFIGYYIR